MTKFHTYRICCLLLSTPLILSTATSDDGSASNANPPIDFQSKDASSPPFVGNRELTPNWLSESQFWYAAQKSPSEREFVLVDIPSKSSRRANSIAELQLGPQSPNSGSGGARIVPSESFSDDRISVTFKNDTSSTIDLHWIGFDGRPRKYATLKPSETATQSTFVGHSWVATNEKRTPIWTALASQAGETISIIEMSLAPYPAFDRRRERRNDESSTESAWRAELDGNNLVFKSKDGQRSFSTASIPEVAGSSALVYSDRVLWSPDSKYAITLQTEVGDHREVVMVESSPRDQLQPKRKTVRYDKPGDKLDVPVVRLFDLERQASIPIDNQLFRNPWSIDDIRWAPDSSRVTFIYNERGHQHLKLVAVSVPDGTARILVDESSTTYIDYAAKAYREYVSASNEVIWASERDGWYHLYLYDFQTGQLKNQITKGNWVVRSIERIDTEKRQVWFYAGGVIEGMDPYYRQLCRVDFDGNNFVCLTKGDGDHRCNLSPNREFFVDTYSRVDLAPVHELRSAVDGRLIMELERADASALWAGGVLPPERFVAKGRDGETDIYGIIVRPKNFDPNCRYPIVENIYAGPQDAFVPKSFGPFNEFYDLANKGFIVVKIDGMGTSNRSKKFHDVSYRNLSDGGFPDRILWMKAAAAVHPEMDIERVGIYGGSAGGQNALAALLFFGDFYDAAAADCGCHDNRMDKVWWNELYMGWPIGEHYEANSNVVNAHRLKGKLLLTVGELDTNVDPASTMQVVDALIRADKDFELIVVPGAGHGVGSTPYCKRRRDDFFIRHLQP